MESIRVRVAQYGLRVVCLACTARGRHRPNQGRLRQRACPRCGEEGSLAARWWVEKYPEQAVAKRDRFARVRHALS